jgi:hypothetical protein
MARIGTLAMRCLCQLQPYSHWVGVLSEQMLGEVETDLLWNRIGAKNELISHLKYAKKNLEKFAEHPSSCQKWD